MFAMVVCAGDLMGRALEMTVPNSVTGQPPQKHDFAFDRVFAPTAGQVRPLMSACPTCLMQPHQEQDTVFLSLRYIVKIRTHKHMCLSYSCLNGLSSSLKLQTAT